MPTLKNIFTRIACVLVVSASITEEAHADTANPALSATPTERCNALKGVDFSLVPDAPTHISEVKLIEPGKDVPRHCQVSAHIAPSVEILLRLPTDNWNGKFLQLGCGGSCGTIDEDTGDFTQCMASASRGYACILSDNGHHGSGYLWAYNDWPAEFDHAYRGAHITALAGKAITRQFYQKAPRHSYFWGYSTGGRQALMEVQRFPWDFDGIIAGCPSIAEPASLLVSALWNIQALTDDSGKHILQKNQVETLHRAVVARCDLNDGIQDSLIGDPRDCDFDPKELLCTAGKQTACLTTGEIDAVNKLYGGPTTSTGEQIYFPGAMKGSELTWLRLAKVNTEFRQFLRDSFRYTVFDPDPAPTWDLQDFNFDRDPRRAGVAEALYSPTNPDLRRFKAAGGKLLSFVGWNDVTGMSLPVVDYYEITERAMGGRAATQEFFRLFTVPGMEHCTNGDGAFAVDWLSALERWVEEGKAPDRLLSAHVRLSEGEEATRLKYPIDPMRVKFSRPVYPYPLKAKYLGRGDRNSASSFGPGEPGVGPR